LYSSRISSTGRPTVKNNASKIAAWKTGNTLLSQRIRHNSYLGHSRVYSRVTTTGILAPRNQTRHNTLLLFPHGRLFLFYFYFFYSAIKRFLGVNIKAQRPLHHNHRCCWYFFFYRPINYRCNICGNNNNKNDP